MKCDNWIACLAHLQKKWPPDIFCPTLPSKFAMLTQTGRFAKERVLKSKSAIKQICLRTEHLCLTRSPIGNPCSANDQTAMGQKVTTMVVNMWILIKMTGGALEVRSDQMLTLLTFGIWLLTFDFWHLTFDIWQSIFDIWNLTNGLMDQWTNGPMEQWTNEPMDQCTNGIMDQWTKGPIDQ